MEKENSGFHLSLFSIQVHRLYTSRGNEWQEIGKGESVVSLLVNEHDEVKLHSYGLETRCINCCILFPASRSH